MEIVKNTEIWDSQLCLGILEIILAGIKCYKLYVTHIYCSTSILTAEKTELANIVLQVILYFYVQ